MVVRTLKDLRIGQVWSICVRPALGVGQRGCSREIQVSLEEQEHEAGEMDLLDADRFDSPMDKTRGLRM